MKKFIALFSAIVMIFSTLTTNCFAIAQQSLTANSYSSSKDSTSKPNPPAYIKNINNESIILYKSSGKILANESYRHTFLYNFSSSMSAGLDPDGDDIACETYYGIKGYIKDGKIYLKAYNNTDKKISVKSTKIYFLDASEDKRVNLNGLKFSYRPLDINKFKNGLHRFSTTMSTGKTIHLYFYVNGKEAYFCQMEYESKYDTCVARRKAVLNAIKKANVTPSNSKSLDHIYYPFYKFDDNYRCDTKLWADFSKTLVKPEWSDERKVFTFCVWLSENIAYDYYHVTTMHASRAKYYKDFSGKYSTYDTKVGVCFDYANILLIMCRANNIPAITLESLERNHAWNAVYINNRWYEFDIVKTKKYIVYGEKIKFEEDTNNIGDYSNLFRYSPNVYGNALVPKDLTANGIAIADDYSIM